MAITIALVDDHPILLRGLKDMLESSSEDLKVTGTYLSAAQLLEALGSASERPEVLLIDISMPQMNGEELAEILQRDYPEIALIVFTNMKKRYYLRSMIQKGVLGYVLKNSSEQTLLNAIRTVHDGKLYFDPLIQEEGMRVLKSATANSGMQVQISAREKEVLELLAENFSSKEIAEKLFVTKYTVDFHRANLLLKLDVKGRANLVEKARELGLIK